MRRRGQADAQSSRSELVTQKHVEDTPFARPAEIEAHDGREIPRQAETDSTVELPILEGRVANRIEDAAGIDERHQHKPEMLIPEHPFAEAPPQFSICKRGGAANEPIRDESAQGGMAAQTIGVAVGEWNDRSRVERYVAELHDVGRTLDQNEASGITEEIVVSARAEVRPWIERYMMPETGAQCDSS